MADSFAGGRGGENASDLPSCQGRKQKSTKKKRRNTNVGEHLSKATEDLIRPAGIRSGVSTRGKIICVIRNIKSGPTGHLATCAPTLAQPRGYGARIANQDYLQGGWLSTFCAAAAQIAHFHVGTWFKTSIIFSAAVTNHPRKSLEHARAVTEKLPQQNGVDETSLLTLSTPRLTVTTTRLHRTLLVQTSSFSLPPPAPDGSLALDLVVEYSTTQGWLGWPSRYVFVEDAAAPISPPPPSSVAHFTNVTGEFNLILPGDICRIVVEATGSGKGI